MIEWSQCEKCQQPTTAGSTCYACAAELIREAQEKGHGVRVVVDGLLLWFTKQQAAGLKRPPGLVFAPLCLNCGVVMEIMDKRFGCRTCGWKDSET